MTRKRFLAAAVAALSLAALTPASAQLVTVDRTYQVVRVDEALNRIEVTAVGGDTTSAYVLVNGYTQVTRQGQPVSWKVIPPHTIINVHGGLTWDMKVHAQRIWYLQ